MKPPIRSRALAQGFAIVSVLATACAWASPLALYEGPTITDAMKADSRACQSAGDAITCSAGMLNVLANRSSAAKGVAGSVIESSPALLTRSMVIVGGNSAVLGNGDISPAAAAVQNGYDTSGNPTILATGKSGSTQGNLGDPAINGLSSNQNAKGTWDVSIEWLINALTLDRLRRELMFAFDYNRPAGSSGTIDYWALVTVRDVAADGSTTRQKNFEIKNDFLTGYAGFNSSKTFESKPDGSEFSTFITVTCYKGSGATTSNVISSITGTCPDDTYSKVDNAQGEDTTEFILFMPELSAGLEDFLAEGYDTISVRFALGCFNDPGVAASTGYLSSGRTVHCETGGTQSLYLLANGGSPVAEVAEPQTFALSGLALLMMAVSRRRRAH